MVDLKQQQQKESKRFWPRNVGVIAWGGGEEDYCNCIFLVSDYGLSSTIPVVNNWTGMIFWGWGYIRLKIFGVSGVRHGYTQG